MKVVHLVVAATALLVGSSCADSGDRLGPTSPEFALQGNSARSAVAKEPVAATGEFAALVDFSTLTLTPRGRNCLLVVSGQLVFTGTIEGTAPGTTRALVFAPCSEVMAAPPGTHSDVFKSELEFEGTIDGVPAAGHMVYQGSSQPGGQIEARLLLSHGISGALKVDAQLAVGGTYEGRAIVH